MPHAWHGPTDVSLLRRHQLHDVTHVSEQQTSKRCKQKSAESFCMETILRRTEFESEHPLSVRYVKAVPVLGNTGTMAGSRLRAPLGSAGAITRAQGSHERAEPHTALKIRNWCPRQQRTISGACRNQAEYTQAKNQLFLFLSNRRKMVCFLFSKLFSAQ